jgi:cation transport ATPase
MKHSFRIEGMHCAACVVKIKSALSPHYNVEEVTLNPPKLTIEAEKSPILNELNTYISSAGKYKLHPIENGESSKEQASLKSYYPIFLITAYIILVASINNFSAQGLNWMGWMQQFMAGFFLIFSAWIYLSFFRIIFRYFIFNKLVSYIYCGFHHNTHGIF